MLRGIPLLFVLSLGCASTVLTPIHKGKGQAIYAMESCSQGPFQYQYEVGQKPQREILRLTFQGADPAIKLFYRIEIVQSGRVLASGFLEKEAKELPGGVSVKNPCVGRQMPSLVTNETGEGGGGASGGGVVVPGSRMPSFALTLPQTSLPEGAPSVDIPLGELAPGTRLALVFWSEEPYPFERAIINMAGLELERQPSKEALARKAEKERLAKENKVAREREKSARLIKKKDEELARLKKKDARLAARISALPPWEAEKKLRLEALRGKRIIQYQHKLEDAYHDNAVYEFPALYKAWNELLQKAQAFYTEMAREREAYSLWQAKKAEEKAKRRTERREKEKLVQAEREEKKAARVLAREMKRFARIKARDAKLAEKVASLTPDEAEKKKELEVFRGRILKRYFSHFFRLVQGRHYHKKYSVLLREKLSSEVSAFRSERSAQLAAFSAWKQEKKAARDQAKYVRKEERREAKRARLEKKAERVLAREMGRFEALKARDAKLAEKVDSLAPDDAEGRFFWEARHGALLKKYSERVASWSSSKRYQRKIRELLQAKLNPLVQSFLSERQKQLAAYALWQQKKEERRYQREQTLARKKEEKRKERLVKQGGAYRESKRWARFRAWEKEILARIAALGPEKEALREKLSLRRARRLEERISALFLAYDRTSPEGRELLASAYSEALALAQESSAAFAGVLSPPPLPAMENPGEAPMVGAVWRPGYWKAEGGEWVWKPGFWELPPGAVPPPPGGQGGVLVPQPDYSKGND